MSKPEGLNNAKNGVIVFNQVPASIHDPLSATREIIKIEKSKNPPPVIAQNASCAIGETLQK